MARIAHLLNTTATIGTRTATSVYGDATYGTQTTVTCRYQAVSQRVMTPNQTEVVSNAVLYTESPVTYDDIIWPPGANTSDPNEAVHPLLIKHSQFPSGEDGHYEVFV